MRLRVHLRRPDSLCWGQKLRERGRSSVEIGPQSQKDRLILRRASVSTSARTSLRRTDRT